MVRLTERLQYMQARCGAPRVSWAIDSIGDTGRRAPTMIDLSALLWSFRRALSAGWGSGLIALLRRRGLGSTGTGTGPGPGPGLF